MLPVDVAEHDIPGIHEVTQDALNLCMSARADKHNGPSSRRELVHEHLLGRGKDGAFLRGILMDIEHVQLSDINEELAQVCEPSRSPVAISLGVKTALGIVPVLVRDGNLKLSVHFPQAHDAAANELSVLPLMGRELHRSRCQQVLEDTVERHLKKACSLVVPKTKKSVRDLSH